MKKFISTIIALSMFSSCILFKQSDLDPESDLSLLYGLFLLNKRYEWKWEYKFIDSASPTAPVLHRVSKIGLNDTLPTPINDIEQGTFIGTFIQNPDKITRIYFPELGRYRIDSYLFNQTHLAATIVDHLSPGDGIISIVETKLVTSITQESLGVQRIQKRSQDPYQVFEEHPSLGYFKGRHYFALQIGFNKDISIQTTALSRKIYPLITSTEDGITWETIPIKELVLDSIGNNSSKIEMGIPFAVGETFYTPVIITVSNVQTERYFIAMPINDRKNYTLVSFTNKLAGYDLVTLNKFRYFQNHVIYEETDSLGANINTLQRDSNFLQPGSANTALPTGNPYNNVNYPITFDSFVLGSDKTGGYDILNSSFTDSVSTYAHTSPLSGTERVIAGSSNRVFLFEGTASNYRFSNLSTTIQSTAIPLSFTGDALVASASTQAKLTGYGVDDSYTYFDVNFASSSTRKYYKADHGSGTFSEFFVKSDFSSIPGFPVEGPCRLNLQQLGKQTLSIGNNLYICFKIPSVADAVPTVNEVQDFRKVLSVSNDGINWTEWSEPVLDFSL